jgi:hypothetical protein
MINLDDSVENSDWAKGRSWDLPTTLDPLLSVIGFSSDSVKNFLALPAAKAIPIKLRIELNQYLKSINLD